MHHEIELVLCKLSLQLEKHWFYEFLLLYCMLDPENNIDALVDKNMYAVTLNVQKMPTIKHIIIVCNEDDKITKI